LSIYLKNALLDKYGSPSPTNPADGTYEWFAFAGLEKESAVEWTFYPDSAGLGTHELTYTFTEGGTPSAKKCSNQDQMQIEVLQSPRTTVPDQYDMCMGDTILLDNVNPIGGDWEDDTGYVTKDGLYIPKAPGTYEVRYKGYSAGNRCMVKDTSRVVVHPNPKFDIGTKSGDRQYCSNETIELDVKPGGSWAPSEGIWELNDDATIGGQSLEASRPGQGEHEVKYTKVEQIKFDLSCSTSDSFNVDIDPEPSVNIMNDNEPACIGNAYELEAVLSHAKGLNWSTNRGTGGRFVGNGFSDSTLANDTGRVSYLPGDLQNQRRTFKVAVETYGSGVCEAKTDTASYAISPKPEPEFTSDTAGCPPYRVEFKDQSSIPGNGALDRWEWDFGDGKDRSFSRNPVHTFVAPKTAPAGYDVQLKLTSKAGCQDSVKKENYVTVHQPPKPDFLGNPTYTTINAPTIDFENKSKNVGEFARYFWDFGDPISIDGGKSTKENPSYTYSDTGLYTIKLRATSQRGCTDTIVKKNYIEIVPQVIVHTPNAFSPNNDGHNDQYRVEASIFSSFEIFIYNRWGELLYESNSYEGHGWDGTYNGSKVQEDVYMYIVKVTGLKGKEYQYSGNITLLR
jgi:gliding motility-associated-like protein